MTSVDLAILEHVGQAKLCPSIWSVSVELRVPYCYIHRRVKLLAASGYLQITPGCRAHAVRIAVADQQNTGSQGTGHNG